MPRRLKPPEPFRGFDSSPEVIRYAVMIYVRYALSLRNVEDLLHERGTEIGHETVRHWCACFGPVIVTEIRRKRVKAMRQHTQWRWRLDAIYVRINGEMRHYGEPSITGEGCSSPSSLRRGTRPQRSSS